MSIIVAGGMSGTSADGINVALVRFSADPERTSRPSPHKKQTSNFTLLAHQEYPFPAPVRSAILAMMNAELARVDEATKLRSNLMQTQAKKCYILPSLLLARGILDFSRESL